MEMFVARRPIFDGITKEVHGYELDFRNGFDDYCHDLQQSVASMKLTTLNSFRELTTNKMGIIDFNAELLTHSYPLLLPKDVVIVGIPGDNNGADDAVVSACEELKEFDYTLAMNDFTLDRLESPLMRFIDLAGVDFAQVTADDRKAACEKLHSLNIHTIARNVETFEELDEAISLGYSYVQGDFYKTMVPGSDKRIGGNKLVQLRIIDEVTNPRLSYDEIANLMRQDVSMTYKLLRFINSAAFGLRYEVNSIKHALVMLGPKEIKKWVMLIALNEMRDEKPGELIVRSLTRAKVAEKLSELAGMENYASELFLMGMFSVIDALTDTPMAEAMEQLPLNPRIKNALLGRPSPFRGTHETILAYETGNWSHFSMRSHALGIDEAKVPDIFRNARTWAGKTMGLI